MRTKIRYLCLAVALNTAYLARAQEEPVVVSETPAPVAPEASPAADLIIEDRGLVAPTRPVPADPQLETPEERDRRLIEKHLPPVDRNLFNRIILPIVGESNASRARRLEREEEIQLFKVRMDPVLDGLRRTDPAEYRRLRSAYHETLYRLYRELRGE